MKIVSAAFPVSWLLIVISFILVLSLYQPPLESLIEAEDDQ